MIVSSVDIGTNTIRLLIAKKIGDCSFDFLYRKSRIARLGEGLEQSGNIKESAIDRAIEILLDFKQVAEKFGVEKIVYCATSATREAKNRDKFLERCRKVGIDVSVLDESEEAYLTHLGIVYCLKERLKGKRWLAFDLGGGSTEFMLSSGSTLEHSISIPLGVVKLLERFVRHDPPRGDELERSTSFFIDKLKRIGIDYEFEILVANAGTVTTLAAIDMDLESYNYSLTEGYKLRKENIEKILKNMLKLSANDRLKRFKILEKGREDVIVVGAHLVLGLLNYFKKEYLLTTNGSLREGILIKEFCGGRG